MENSESEIRRSAVASIADIEQIVVAECDPIVADKSRFFFWRSLQGIKPTLPAPHYAENIERAIAAGMQN